MKQECNEKELHEIIESVNSRDDTPLEYKSPILRRLEERCKDGGIECELIEHSSPRQGGIQIYLPAGREKISLTVRNNLSAELLLCVPFESIHGLNEYRAFYSYDDGYIEAMIETGLRFEPPSSFLLGRLQRILSDQNGTSEENYERERIVFPPDEKRFPNVRVSIGYSTYTFFVLELLRRPMFLRSRFRNVLRPLTIRIEGVSISNYEQVKSVLEKFANAVFFQLDLLAGSPMHLALNREMSSMARPRRRLRFSGEANLSFPKYQYDAKPMSLYWYASMAEGMPLLQYLAYYQVIEFYFPMFAEKAMHKIVQRMLKDPSFDVNRDIDISRLLASLKPYLAKDGFGNEQSALLATVRECVTEQELRDFFAEDESMIDFYKTNSQLISAEKISVESSKADIVTQVAKRIYDIRCKIVHTKSSAKSGQSDLLLPFSKEAQYLGFDIELVRFIARKVLIASSRPFTL